MPERQVRDARRERTRGLEHEVLLGRSGHLGARTNDVEAQTIAGSQGQPIAGARKAHQAFEVMIAVGPPADDPQGQIDLGRRRLSEIEI